MSVLTYLGVFITLSFTEVSNSFKSTLNSCKFILVLQCGPEYHADDPGP